MRFAISLTTTRLVMGCVCAGALGAAGCADGRGVPTSPSASAAISGSASTAPGNERASRLAVESLSARSGDFHVTKECSEYTGQIESFCTITSSNVKAIEVGSRIVYAQAAGATSLDSDIALDLPGPGNNTAFGHCRLDFVTRVGMCTFSGGTGKFTHFQARGVHTDLGARSWALDGTYSFGPRD
jgi:hypothetical protein